MFSDQWENDYMEFIEQNPLTLCSGLSYRGKSNKLEHAQRMNALIFDLDGVGLKELRNLFLRFGGDPTRDVYKRQSLGLYGTPGIQYSHRTGYDPDSFLAAASVQPK